MNMFQRVALSLALVLIILMALFPPWRTIHVDRYRDFAIETKAGYSFLFYPPKGSTESGATVESARVDLSLLVTQWAIVVGTTGLLLVFSSKRTRDERLRKIVDS